MCNPPVVMTERLFLRPVELGDAPETSALMTPAISAKLQTWPRLMSVSEARSRIAHSRREAAIGEWFDWGIFSKIDLILMGWVGLGRSDIDRSRLVIGFWLGEPFQRRGFASEAIPALIDRACDMFGIFDVDAFVQPTDSGSAKLLERMGFANAGRQMRYADSRDRVEEHLRFARRCSSDAKLSAAGMAISLA